MSITKRLTERKIAHPPSWLPDNVYYETYMGSVAYGTSSDNSDIDVYGFCIPTLNYVFPHTTGEIVGFGTQQKRFNQYSEHHLKADEKQYDLTIYNIVDYFNLCLDCNPNMLDSLWTPINCVATSTAVSELVRSNRRLFLTKKLFHKFKGYSYSQAHKIRTKNPEGSRRELIEKFGYDTKYAGHLVRLLLECEMLLTEGDMDLQRHSEQLKGIRRGEWPEERVFEFFNEKERQLEKAYTDSALPHSPLDIVGGISVQDRVKQLLLECLEHHYGNLSNVGYRNPDDTIRAIQEIHRITSRFMGVSNGWR